MNEGARWVRTLCTDCGIVWVLFPAGGVVPSGMAFHRPDIGWCAHVRGIDSVRTGIAFVDAIAIVEQAATNALDESTAASTV